MKPIRLTATQTIALGYALIILAGALILMLPVCNRDETIGFLDALFTSTSATCITGLVVCDTYTQFSDAGQAVLLVLIQLGGLGFATVLMMLLLALRQRIGLRERALLSESINLSRVGGILKLVRRILIGTAIAEAAGTMLLAIRFVPYFGWKTGLWYSLFHAVSAFTNAGFDLMGRMCPFSSMTAFRDDTVVNLTIILLVIIGGLGFVVWSDAVDYRLHLRQYSLHSKVMLLGSVVLIAIPFAVLLFCESTAGMKNLSGMQKAQAVLFQIVAARTGGMTTVEISEFSTAGLFLLTCLMFIGAGPGSTGGGIKVTTATVAVLAVHSYMHGRRDVNILNRRIEPSLVRRAILTCIFYFLLAMLAVLCIELIQELPLRDVLMEVVSALGTVGLSTGVTRALKPASRVVLILLMYSGRIGSLTVLLSVSERRPKTGLRKPAESIIVS